MKKNMKALLISIFSTASIVLVLMYCWLMPSGCISTEAAVRADSADPWAGCTALNGDQLKSALNDLIDGQHSLTYDEIWDALKVCDEDPVDSRNVVLVYTRNSLSKDLTQNGPHANDPDAWNREHLWPKSHGFPAPSSPAYTDLHHLRPADASVNSSRGTKDFDESEKPHHEALLCSADRDSWEPPETVKGDIARALFYMAVRYEGEHGEIDLELIDDAALTVSGEPYFGVLNTLLNWSKSDPPDETERLRNDRVERLQGNRNPFVDRPEFADRIWQH